MSTNPIRPVAYVQPDHLDVLSRTGKHLVRMSANPDGPCLMPLYTEQALWELRQRLIQTIRADVATLVLDYFNKAFSPEPEMSQERIMREIESLKDTDKEHP